MNALRKVRSRGSADAVRAARVRWKRRRVRLIRYGLWNPWADAAPVRARVRELMADRVALNSIAAGSGVGKWVFNQLLYGRPGQPPSSKVRTEHAQAILAFRPALDDYADTALVNATGSRRRLQALAVLGIPVAWTGNRIGCRRKAQRLGQVNGQPHTSAATARLIRTTYNELWDADPADLGIPDQLAERTRRAARNSKWAGPLAWNDETIDDPDVKPDLGRASRGGVDHAAVVRAFDGERLDLNRPERTAAIEYGARRLGLPFTDIAEHLDMEYDTVKRSWERIKRRARDAGETWPDSPKWTVDPQLASQRRTA